MLCLPADVPASIAAIKEAIDKKQLTWDDIYQKCKKVLAAKYTYGLGNIAPINIDHLTEDLNRRVMDMKRTVAENAITLLNKEDDQFFPLRRTNPKNQYAKDVAYIGIGLNNDNAFARRMRSDYNADVFYFNYKQDPGRILSTVSLIKSRYRSVIIGIHNYNRYPANNFGIDTTAINFVHQLQEQTKNITFVFGNPYAIKNFCDAKNLIACYEDDSITQTTAIDILEGKLLAKGKLPVTVCDNYKYGSGLALNNTLPVADPVAVGLDPVKLNVIDSIAEDAIAKGATPGAVILVVKDGKIAYQKAFGTYDYGRPESVTLQSIFDMASVTKICATTLSVMKLYDEGKLDLKKHLGDYLPWVRGTDEENLLIENILLHQAGLIAYIPFYKETIDSVTKVPLPNIYSKKQNDTFSIRVAENLFMRTDWRDTMYKRMVESKLGPSGKYIYSDNDFIFLGKIVEALTGQTLDQYVKKTFYDPMGLTSTGFKPRERFPLDRIMPTETEKYFRLQHLRGDVHDPGSAMFGGVAGHAGLFSTAYDLGVIMQMLLNGGTINGKQFIKPGTIKLFTSYNSSISRRGFGFDKPEKDNATLKEPYPSALVSPLTFGHTGYTGTCVWADPKYNIAYIFLSSRVNPNGGDNLILSRLNVRGKIQDQIYKAMGL
jgi:Beta-lactamase class C and other penicillin binding proteins